MKKGTLLFFLFVITLGAFAQNRSSYKYRPTRMTYKSYLHTQYYIPLTARHLLLNQQIFRPEKMAESVSLHKVHGVYSSLNSLSTKLSDLSLSHEDIKLIFSIHTGGTPIVFPLVYESDPCLSLMLVSNDSIDIAVDRVYIVDATRDDFDFLSDIYQMDSVKCFIDADGGYSKIIAVASHYGTKHEFEIDEFIYSEILKINKGRAEFKSNITIPVMKIEAGRIEEE